MKHDLKEYLQENTEDTSTQDCFRNSEAITMGDTPWYG